MSFALISQFTWADTFYSPKPQVVATIKPLALIAQELTGDDFNVTTLLPSSANPHASSMSIKERQAINDADLVLWLGNRFERFLAKPMANHKRPQLELGAIGGLSWPGEPYADLHLWMQIDNIKAVLKAIAPQLIALSPLKASVIQARLEGSIARLDKTHAAIKLQLQPYSDAKFIVSHDGYGHFVNAYGLNQVAAASKLPEEQLSARKMMELKRASGGIKCLIAEPNERIGSRLSATLGLPLVIADPLGRSESITDITGLLLALAQNFYTCLQPS